MSDCSIWLGKTRGTLYMIDTTGKRRSDRQANTLCTSFVEQQKRKHCANNAVSPGAPGPAPNRVCCQHVSFWPLKKQKQNRPAGPTGRSTIKEKCVNRTSHQEAQDSNRARGRLYGESRQRHTNLTKTSGGQLIDEPLQVPAPAEPMQGVREIEYLPAKSPEEPMQRSAGLSGLS